MAIIKVLAFVLCILSVSFIIVWSMDWKWRRYVKLKKVLQQKSQCKKSIFNLIVDLDMVNAIEFEGNLFHKPSSWTNEQFKSEIKSLAHLKIESVYLQKQGEIISRYLK